MPFNYWNWEVIERSNLVNILPVSRVNTSLTSVAILRWWVVSLMYFNRNRKFSASHMPSINWKSELRSQVAIRHGGYMLPLRVNTRNNLGELFRVFWVDRLPSMVPLLLAILNRSITFVHVTRGNECGAIYFVCSVQLVPHTNQWGGNLAVDCLRQAIKCP